MELEANDTRRPVKCSVIGSEKKVVKILHRTPYPMLHAKLPKKRLSDDMNKHVQR